MTRIGGSWGRVNGNGGGLIHVAFSQHHPLVLSPDVIWLTILSGVAQHVKLNAETLRPRLVRHQGKRELKVPLTESLEVNPAAARNAVAGFRTAIAKEIGQGPAALLTCDFSTTTDIERAASEILLMDTYSPYFDYTVECVCGIPELTLLGEPSDWRELRKRIDILAELDLAWWTSSLAPILDKFIAASEGNPDAAFFRDIYKPYDAYGGEIIAGWSARFYPYLASDGRFDRRNPLLELPITYRPPQQDKNSFDYTGVGIRADDVPASLGSCIIKVEDAITNRHYTLELRGGLIGVELDAHRRLAPCAAWTVDYAKSNLSALIDARRQRPDFIAEPPEPRPQYMPFSTGDRLALADAFGPARLFIGTREWHLRAPSQAQYIEIYLPVRGTRETACRLIDLPDNTCICYVQVTRTPSVIRLRNAELEPLPEPEPDTIKLRDDPTFRTRQHPRDIDVVGDSLAEVLTRALESNGEVPVAVTNMAAKFADNASWRASGA